MKMQESDVEEIKNFLQKNWQNRNRWVAYKDNDIVTPISMIGFRTANDANAYCENGYKGNYQFRFKSIGSVLKRIFESMGSLIKTPPNIRRLELEIKQKSIVPNSWDDNLVNSLQSGEIYPVIQQREVNPLNIIGSYKILKQQEGSDTVSRIAETLPTEIASYRDYQQANRHFTNISDPDQVAISQQPSYFLVGEFKDHKLIMGKEGFPEKNTGLLLSMWRSLLSIDDSLKPYGLIAVHDVKSVAIINEPMLAQYNSQTHKINLMDGHLKPIVAGKLAPYMEVDHFAFKSPITVLPDQIQALWQKQKNVHIVETILRNRVQ